MFFGASSWATTPFASLFAVGFSVIVPSIARSYIVAVEQRKYIQAIEKRKTTVEAETRIAGVDP